jgi:nitrate/nitrite-specific signal transduction histidine kinase
MSGDEHVLSRAEEFLGIFKRGAEFSRELLVENERLRSELMRLQDRQQTAATSPEQWSKLRHELLERIHTLEQECTSVRGRLAEVGEENGQFARRYVEIEEENNNLANLYVASYQLHSTLDPSEVLKVILEIVINLIGAEYFCVYVCDEQSDVLRPVAAEGGGIDGFPEVRLGEGPVGESVVSGEVMSSEGSDLAPMEGGQPVVCIPLRVEDKPVGAIVIHRLLSQKDGFSALDQELFTLLAGHAATAIFASRLYAQSERKLNTIQGFIDLLTK